MNFACITALVVILPEISALPTIKSTIGKISATYSMRKTTNGVDLIESDGLDILEQQSRTEFEPMWETGQTSETKVHVGERSEDPKPGLRGSTVVVDKISLSLENKKKRKQKGRGEKTKIHMAKTEKSSTSPTAKITERLGATGEEKMAKTFFSKITEAPRAPDRKKALGMKNSARKFKDNGKAVKETQIELMIPLKPSFEAVVAFGQASAAPR